MTEDLRVSKDYRGENLSKREREYGEKENCEKKRKEKRV